nr:unnamed protein product [Callosobruchus chinensis]
MHLFVCCTLFLILYQSFLASHYCRESTSKLYLEPIWDSKAHLYKIYKTDYCQMHNEKPQYSIRNLIRRDSPFKAKKDLCDTFVAFETENLTEDKYSNHIKLKKEARNEKSRDK